ncbi:hypothetical protein [Marinimicrobium sp. ARAG 43.8]|uniref:hypothetical protein n=1 Tax=Marinimicrobium sp. ARAG 43.8 TaxID=3418719 RepID=UPI003CE7395B
MRAIAEFILRGRLQATVVALIGNWVPLLTPATVALVTLRAGSGNGLLILLWGVLPALLLLGISQIGPAVAIAVVGGIVLTFLAALLLRKGAGWAASLMALVGSAALVALLQIAVAPDSVQAVLGWLTQFMDELSDADSPVPALSPTFVVGLMAYSMAYPAAFGLVLGRWWQALAVNPGGFGAEFQALKLHPVQAVTCMAASVYCLLQGVDYSLWAGLFMLPLVFQGVAIVHRLVAIKKAGVQWLVMFYVALVLLEPATQLLAVIAFLDTWLKFRERATPKG